MVSRASQASPDRLRCRHAQCDHEAANAKSLKTGKSVALSRLISCYGPYRMLRPVPCCGLLDRPDEL